MENIFFTLYIYKTSFAKIKKPAGASPRYGLRVFAQEILSGYLDSCQVIRKKTSEKHAIRNGGLHLLLQKSLSTFHFSDQFCLCMNNYFHAVSCRVLNDQWGRRRSLVYSRTTRSFEDINRILLIIRQQIGMQASNGTDGLFSSERIERYPAWPIWLFTWSLPTLTWGQILKFTLLGHHACISNRLNKRNTMVSESCRYLL